MSRHRRQVALYWVAMATIATALSVPPGAVAQTAISAQAGMINHVEGRVLLDDEPVLDHPGRFLHVEHGQHLRTERGRAEVLFAIGTYLRLAENSEIEMVSAVSCLSWKWSTSPFS